MRKTSGKLLIKFFREVSDGRPKNLRRKKKSEKKDCRRNCVHGGRVVVPRDQPKKKERKKEKQNGSGQAWLEES